MRVLQQHRRFDAQDGAGDRHRLVAGLALLASLAVAIGVGPSYAGEKHVPGAKTIGQPSSQGPIPSLAVLNSAGATLEGNKLTLTGVLPNTIVFADRPVRYPTVSLEEVRAADPEVILLPDEPFRFRRIHLADFAPLAGTSALSGGRVHFVDGKLLSWYGARIGAALTELPSLLAG